MTTRIRTRLALAALLLAAAAPLAAQRRPEPDPVPKSQLGSLSQDLAGTRIEIVYRRPVARGRALFGDLVPYGRVWTPSADSAAQLRLSTDREWTVTFSDVAHVFHLRYPGGHDVLRVQAVPETG